MRDKNLTLDLVSADGDGGEYLIIMLMWVMTK